MCVCVGGTSAHPPPLNCPQAQNFSACIGKKYRGQAEARLRRAVPLGKVLGWVPGASGEIDGSQWKGVEEEDLSPWASAQTKLLNPDAAGT